LIGQQDGRDEREEYQQIHLRRAPFALVNDDDENMITLPGQRVESNSHAGS
jgi:hypothetical protein